MMNSAPAAPRFGSMLLAAAAGGAIAFGASGAAPAVRVMHGTSRPQSVSAGRAILPLPTKRVESRPVPTTEPESTPFGNDKLPGGRPATSTPSSVPSDPEVTHFVPVEQTFPVPAETMDDAPSPDGLAFDAEAPSGTTDFIDSETEAQGRIDSSSVDSASANPLRESPWNEQLDVQVPSPSANQEFMSDLDQTPTRAEAEHAAVISPLKSRGDHVASPNGAVHPETEASATIPVIPQFLEQSSRSNPVWLALMGIGLGGGLVILAQWVKVYRLPRDSILQVRIVASDVGMFAAPVSSLPAAPATQAPAADVEPQRGVAVEDFADGGPVLLPLETWDQQQRIRLARLEEVERGMMRKIFEDNEILQRQLVA